MGVSVEAVEQFQVETSGTGVEFNGQGSENYTIKSGATSFTAGVRIPPRIRWTPEGAARRSASQLVYSRGDKKSFLSSVPDGWRYRVVSPTTRNHTDLKSEREISPGGGQYHDPTSTVCVANMHCAHSAILRGTAQSAYLSIALTGGPPFSDLESLPVTLARADEYRRREQLSGPGTGWVQQQ
jgi:hypothetical protein